MRKALVVILAIAILGGLTVAANKQSPASASTTASNAKAPMNANSPASKNAASVPKAAYKDGKYNGDSAESPYGNVQIAVVISNGRIADIIFMEMPYESGHTKEVSDFSKPILKQRAISKQSANIDFVSGATDTSYAFEASLQAALDKAAL